MTELNSALNAPAAPPSSPAAKKPPTLARVRELLKQNPEFTPLDAARAYKKANPNDKRSEQEIADLLIK